MIASRFCALIGRLLEFDSFRLDALDSRVLAHFKSIYGCGLLQSRLHSLARHLALFIDAYGDGPVEVLRAPARINILGEHVDYVSYLPTASLTFGCREHEMVLCYRADEGGRIRGRSTLTGSEAFEFNLKEAPGEDGGKEGNWESFVFSRGAPAPHWRNYVMGAAFFARMKHRGRIHRGIDFTLDSSIPAAGGASSSSALTVLAGAALLRANAVSWTPIGLALDSAQAEWFIGTRGGTMDHLTICLAREGCAVHISYADGRCETVPLPDTGYRWLTFFSQPADKSRTVMLEYNERAAVARIWIPAILQGWRLTDPLLFEAWTAARQNLLADPAGALNTIERLIENLPETLAFRDAERRYPDAFLACCRSFPALVEERRVLRVRDRARHHVGEVRRVSEAKQALSGTPDAETRKEVMQCIGNLLNASHASLRDLYEVCTSSVDALFKAVLSDPGTLGARLMGAGFGGNLLTLTTGERTHNLIRRIQESYYGPLGRNGIEEGAVRVATPGTGLSALDAQGAVRNEIEEFNAGWRAAPQKREEVRRLLGLLEPDKTEVWPIVLAAGEGKRARSSGLHVPKPLAAVLGVPCVTRVSQAIQRACKPSRSLIVIVSPATEVAVRAALKDQEVAWVMQPKPLGTADAIMRARSQMGNFQGRALIAWGTQPVLRSETISCALRLAELFPEYQMVLPTTTMERPYAPVLRDQDARICSACETHLENASPPEFGETNVGLFLLWSNVMFQELEELCRSAWLEARGCYDREGGELGFPNEMIRKLASRPAGVVASPLADWREQKGIKTLADVTLCERYMQELAGPALP